MNRQLLDEICVNVSGMRRDQLIEYLELISKALDTTISMDSWTTESFIIAEYLQYMVMEITAQINDKKRRRKGGCNV